MHTNVRGVHQVLQEDALHLRGRDPKTAASLVLSIFRLHYPMRFEALCSARLQHAITAQHWDTSDVILFPTNYSSHLPALSESVSRARRRSRVTTLWVSPADQSIQGN